MELSESSHVKHRDSYKEIWNYFLLPKSSSVYRKIIFNRDAPIPRVHRACV